MKELMEYRYFSKEETDRIVAEIRQAEANTSGEIRLHVESRCWRDPLKRAAMVFKKLDMHQTRERNATLIYLAMKTRKFAIVGDKGINEKVPDKFWDEIKAEMAASFAREYFCEGVCLGIRQIGEKLSEYYPRAQDDVNELSDEISRGD